MAQPPLVDEDVQRLLLGRWFETPTARRTTGVSRSPTYAGPGKQLHPKLEGRASAHKRMHRKLVDTDETGLDKAYASPTNLHLDGLGTLYVSGTKGGFTGNEWIENYIDFGVPLATKLANRKPLEDTSYDVSKMGRYQELDQFVKDNPGSVKNLVGHSKGSAVIDAWMKKNPEFSGQARLYSTPYDDPLGKERAKDWLAGQQTQSDILFGAQSFSIPGVKLAEDLAREVASNVLGFDGIAGMQERRQTRIANHLDLAAVLDSSAERSTHPNPLAYLSGGGPHDYHEGDARFTSGFQTAPDRPGGADPNYRAAN